MLNNCTLAYMIRVQRLSVHGYRLPGDTPIPTVISVRCKQTGQVALRTHQGAVIVAAVHVRLQFGRPRNRHRPREQGRKMLTHGRAS